MVTARQSLALLVCLIYVPHITTAFLRNLQKRGGRTRGQDISELAVNRLFFKRDALKPETVATRYGSVVLECEVGGIPTPTIHWLKDGERIPQGSSQVFSKDGASFEGPITHGGLPTLGLSSTGSKLYLDCLTEADEGQYTCVAENAMLRKSQSTLLRVESPDNVLHSEVHECHGRRSHRGEPARIYMWTVSRLEYENSKVQLFCRAEGHPTPAITWYDRDNKQIENDASYTIAENGDLIIRDITWMENMGMYTCVADNGLGSDNAQTFLYPTPRDNGFPL